MTDILLSGLWDHEVQRQALVMKDFGQWLFSEMVVEVMRLEVVRNLVAVMAPCPLAPGVAGAPGLLMPPIAAAVSAGVRPRQQQPHATTQPQHFTKDVPD